MYGWKYLLYRIVFKLSNCLSKNYEEVNMKNYITQLNVHILEMTQVLQIEKETNVINAAIGWILDGWELPIERITIPMIAASLFNEANTQDECVRSQESDASYPELLRETAYVLLRIAGHERK